MYPELYAIAARQGGVFSRGQALAAGHTSEEIRSHLRTKRWQRVRHGQYAVTTNLSGMPPWESAITRYRLRIYAAVNSMRPGSCVVSHQSALVMCDLPVWNVDLDEVHLTRLGSRRCGPMSGVRHHRGRVSPGDVTDSGNLVVTVPARSLVDLAATIPFEQAVVSADAALRRGVTDRYELDQQLRQAEHIPGIPAARAALAFADGRSESVGESRCRVTFHRLGLPPPDLQVDFRDAEGFIGRVDFAFPESGVVVEFDGDVKYGDGAREILLQEKRREDRLRALGLRVIRLNWADLTQPDRIGATLRPLLTPHPGTRTA